MSENSKIEWCDHTFNPWIGCTKVSDGCKNCYAERQDNHRKWTPEGWGKGKPRKRTSEANWKQVERWNTQAERNLFHQCACGYRGSWPGVVCPSCREDRIAKPVRPRVFVGSLMDWLDPEVPIEWLADLLDLFRRCPHLDFLLLTKRPELWERRMRDVAMLFQSQELFPPVQQHVVNWLNGNNPVVIERHDDIVFVPQNVWIGTSVENQKAADERIPALLNIPAKVRFLSCEPLIAGPMDLSAFIGTAPNITGEREYVFNAGIHWVICGGESGPSARPMHPDWARSLRDQCKAAGVPFFFKQWGEWGPRQGRKTPDPTKARHYFGNTAIYRYGKRSNGNLLDGREWKEWPIEFKGVKP